MKKKIFLICFPIVLFSHTINFETALFKTIEMNKGLKAKKLTIEESIEDLNQVKGYDYGSLIFSENISHTNNAGYVFGSKLASREASFGDFGFNEFDMSGSTSMSDLLSTEPNDLNYPESRTNYETKLTYTIPIFTGFKLQNAKKMAKLQILAKTAQYKYDEKLLTLEVLKAYNGAVAAKEFIKANKTAKDATASFVLLSNELYKEGLVTSLDVKQAKVHDMGVDASIIDARNRYELAISYLKFLTSDNTITDVNEFKNINNNFNALQNLQTKAYENRADYKAMKYNTKTMEIKIDMEKASSYPTIGGQLEYGYNDNSFNNIKNDKDYYLAAVGLSYNLFDGFVSSSKIEKSKIEYYKTKYYFEYMKEAIQLEIEKNLLNLQTKDKLLSQKIKANNLSSEVLEQSQELYKNHLINMSDLLLQQAKQQKANAEMILAKYEKSLASALLQISLGEQLK